VDGVLSHGQKIFVWIDKQTAQIQMTGALCQEYFQVRKLVYSHFGRM
jgi:chorismate synthase